MAAGDYAIVVPCSPAHLWAPICAELHPSTNKPMEDHMIPAFFAAFAAIYAPWALSPEDFYPSKKHGES